MKARRLYLVLRIPAAIGSRSYPVVRRQHWQKSLAEGQAASSGRDVKDDVTVMYHITDRDVLNFTDEVKKKTR